MIEMSTQQDDLVRFLAGNLRQHAPGMRDLPRRDLGMQLDQRAVRRAPQLLRLISLQDDAVRAGGLVADALFRPRHSPCKPLKPCFPVSRLRHKDHRGFTLQIKSDDPLRVLQGCAGLEFEQQRCSLLD